VRRVGFGVRDVSASPHKTRSRIASGSGLWYKAAILENGRPSRRVHRVGPCMTHQKSHAIQTPPPAIITSTMIETFGFHTRGPEAEPRQLRRSAMPVILPSRSRETPTGCGSSSRPMTRRAIAAGAERTKPLLLLEAPAN
jgi:hypothetical protein